MRWIARRERSEVEGVEVDLLFVGITLHGIVSHAVEGPARIIQLKHEDIGCEDIIITIEARNFPGNILFLPHAPQHKTGCHPHTKANK
jgi:hypothetical protein